MTQIPEEKKLNIRMGAMCDPISKQLADQDLRFDAAKVKRFEKCLTAILTLKFAEILPDAAAEKCRIKLFNQIKKHINEMNQ
jgi:hypothetical protein